MEVCISDETSAVLMTIGDDLNDGYIILAKINLLTDVFLLEVRRLDLFFLLFLLLIRWSIESYIF